MGAFGVVQMVERVNLDLQARQRLSQWLFIEVPKQGLVEAFVLALCGRSVGFADDRLGSHA